jgi:hypothetical protein
MAFPSSAIAELLIAPKKPVALSKANALRNDNLFFMRILLIKNKEKWNDLVINHGEKSYILISSNQYE